jgi:hypothetical protein
MRKLTFVCLGTLVAGFASQSIACDGVVQARSGGSTSSVTLVIQSTNSIQAEGRLLLGIEKTKEHVRFCESEVVEASEILASAVAIRDAIVSKRASQITSMKLLRDLLSTPGSYVCLDGKSLTKEKIATSLMRALDGFEASSIELDEADIDLQVARESLAAVQAKAHRWQAVQKLLVSRVDSVLKAEQNLRQIVSDESAKNEAFQLVQAIEAKIANSTATVKTSSQPAKPAPAVVSQAIAEFDAIFKK